MQGFNQATHLRGGGDSEESSRIGQRGTTSGSSAVPQYVSPLREKPKRSNTAPDDIKVVHKSLENLNMNVVHTSLGGMKEGELPTDSAPLRLFDEDHIVGPSTAFGEPSTVGSGFSQQIRTDVMQMRMIAKQNAKVARSRSAGGQGAVESDDTIAASSNSAISNMPVLAVSDEDSAPPPKKDIQPDRDSDSGLSQREEARKWAPPGDNCDPPPPPLTTPLPFNMQWPSTAIAIGLLSLVTLSLISCFYITSFLWNSAVDALPARISANFARAARFVKRREVLPILYMLAGYWLADWLSLTANRRYFSGLRIDRTTSIFLKGLVKYASMSIAFTIVLKALGIKTQGLDNILASIGIAIGFASQKILQNLAAGVILLIFRPFKVGDMLNVNGQIGWVTKIMLFETRLRTDDRREICIPNAAVYDSQSLINLTCDPMRRVEIPVYTSGSTDIKLAKKVIEEAIAPFAHYWRSTRKERLVKREKPRRRSATERLIDTLKKSASATFPRLGSSLLVNLDRRDAVNKLERQRSCDDLRTNTQEEPVRQGYGLEEERHIPQSDLPFGMPPFLELDDPFVVLCELDTFGTFWLAMVWVPSRWYYPCRAEIIEAIGEALQKNKVETVSEVLAKRGMPAFSLPKHG